MSSERVRPTCKDCGYQDEETFTLPQLDTCDFECPRCGSNYFDFPRADVGGDVIGEQRPTASSPKTSAADVIPDWRPGVRFWRPTSDGREVGVYAELTGTAKLYRGPLADPMGFDESWRYASVDEAVGAAKAWDGESAVPPGRWKPIELGGTGTHERPPLDDIAGQELDPKRLIDGIVSTINLLESAIDADEKGKHDVEGRRIKQARECLLQTLDRNWQPGDAIQTAEQARQVGNKMLRRHRAERERV